MNGYDLSRKYWDFAFENPDLVKPGHAAIYHFAIEQCNRYGWKEKFGFPSYHCMEATGIKSHNTYKKLFNELVEFGFIKVHEESKNQYTACIIALSNFDKALFKALDKANAKHCSKHLQSTVQGTDAVDKPLNKETIKQRNNKTGRFAPPRVKDVFSHMQEKGLPDRACHAEAEKFCNFYESKDWYVGKNKMKNWKAAATNWANSAKQKAMQRAGYKNPNDHLINFA